MSFRSLKYDARALDFERKAAHNWYLQKGIARNKYKVVHDIEIIFQFYISRHRSNRIYNGKIKVVHL